MTQYGSAPTNQTNPSLSTFRKYGTRREINIEYIDGKETVSSRLVFPLARFDGTTIEVGMPLMIDDRVYRILKIDGDEVDVK